MNIVIGERMQQRLFDEGVPRKQIMQIPNWSSSDDIVPLATANNPLREEWDLSDNFVVGYSGNFGRVHEFQTLLDAAMALQSYAHIKLLLIGGGVRREAVVAFVDQHELSNTVFKSFQPRSRLQESLGVADVHVVSLLPEMEGLIVPSKTYSIAAAGRPVIFIGDRDGEIARLLKNINSALLCLMAIPSHWQMRLFEWQRTRLTVSNWGEMPVLHLIRRTVIRWHWGNGES